MTKPSLLKLLVLAETYQVQAKQAQTKQTALLDPNAAPMPSGGQLNQQYQAQRDRLARFSSHFTSKCRAILGEMSGDIFTLRERKFDPKMLGMIKNLKTELETICKKFEPTKPYVTAYELVDHVLDRPTRILIENLAFFAKHHLQQTKPSGNLLPFFAVPAQVGSLNRLLDFAYSTRVYMEANPMLYVPTFTPTSVPPKPTTEPSLLADPDEKTNAPATKVLTEEPAA